MSNELIARLSYVVENPSAWEGAFDQRISDMIAEAIAALSAQPSGVMNGLREALTAARDAFRTYAESAEGHYASKNDLANDLRIQADLCDTALSRPASVEGGKAVAWMRMNTTGTQSTGVTDTTYYRDLWIKEGDDVRPLYASPVPVSGAPEPEAHDLARFGSASVAPLGLYRVHWKTGGFSLAAIGMMENGDRWIAPTNWVRPGMVASAGEWGEIERLEPIEPLPAPEPVPAGDMERAEAEPAIAPWSSSPDGFEPRDFAYLAELLLSNDGEATLKARLSNNVNVIIAALRRAASPHLLAKPAVQEGWRDMKDAPKDGTRVLIFDPRLGVAIAHFNRSSWQWSNRWYPTLWMPLPLLPASPAPQEPDSAAKEGE